MAMMKRSLAFLMAIVLLAGIMVPAYAEGTSEPVGTAAGDQVQSNTDGAVDPDTTTGQTEEKDTADGQDPSNGQDPSDDQLTDDTGDDDAYANDETSDDHDDNGDGTNSDGTNGDGTNGVDGDEADDGADNDQPVSEQDGVLFSTQQDPNNGQGTKQTLLPDPKNGWKDSGGERFYLADGKAVTGWKKLDGKTYYLKTGAEREWCNQKAVGAMVTDWLWTGGDNWYYFGSDGVLVTGWFKIGDEWYYSGADGKNVRGWADIGGKTYYFCGDGNEWSNAENDGAMVVGWLWKPEGWYYFRPITDQESDDYGKAPLVKNDWFSIGSEWYYSGADGKNVRGWGNIGGKTYYFRGGGNEWNGAKNDGAMVVGWLWKPEGWYYFDPAKGSGDGKAPMVKNDWFQIGSEWYYSGSNGLNLRGWGNIGGKTYYFRGGGNEWSNAKNDGAMVVGWLWKPEGWYYCDPAKGSGDGKAPVVKNDWFKIGSEWYYSAANGLNLRGWGNIGGKSYYFRGGGSEWNNAVNDGAMVVGWLWKPEGWYYFDPAKGSGDGKAPVVKNDWFSIGSEKYYSGADGLNYRGWRTIGGKTYYFRNGSNVWCQQVNDGALATGLVWTGGVWYYLDENGQKTSGWQSMEGHRYYFDGSGVMAHGLRNISGKWYYFNNDGWLLTGSVTLGVKTYSTDADGALVGFNGSQQAINVLNQIGWNLRAAYTWAASLRYANRSYRAGSVDAYASYGFSNGYGNCYVMNACLYKLAQTLGYEVKFINGGVRQSYGGDLPHGWCEINDGGWYVFDSNFHNETGRNGYRISYGQSGTWHYVAYNEMY